MVLALVALFCSLGVWQWSRGAYKDRLLDDVDRVLAERRPQELEVALGSAGPAWVRVEGAFLDLPALRLDNQQRGGRAGVRVYRAFAARSGEVLLVDLGWRPLGGDRAVPDEAPLTASGALQGLLVPPPSAGLPIGPALTEIAPGRGWLALRMDMPALSEAMRRPLAAKVLRLDPAQPLGYERDLDLLANTLPPEKHRGYAVQWFGFAAGLLVLSLFLQFRRRP
jgi:cytochrome oxidase assembly protein ShyY1